VDAPYVYLYDPENTDSPFTWLPNIVLVAVDERTGPNPKTAYFEYMLDDNFAINNSWPSRVDEIWPLDAAGPYVVGADDRIVAALRNADGTTTFLFDGFAQIPQCDVTPRTESASFTAVGVEAREFDNVVNGRVMRNSDPTGIVDTTGDSDVSTDLTCHFNPSDQSYSDDGGYRPNKTPDGYDTVLDEDTDAPAHAVFADAGIQGRDGPSPAYWSIADALRYILATQNPVQKYTSYPDPTTFDGLLQVVFNSDDAGVLTLGDIQTDPLLIRDFDASNLRWPEVVAELLSYAGFLMRWDLGTGSDGLPETMLRIYRADMMSETPVKQVYLDEIGNSLAEGSRNNATRIRLTRDTDDVLNAWQLETNQQQVEISLYLAPLYQPAAADTAPVANSSTSGRNQFTLAALDTNNAPATTRRKYRWYGADELGDGFWNGTNDEWETKTPFDFSGVFPPDEDDGSPNYVVRYRPGLDKLASLDTLKRPLRTRLDIAFGIASSGPVLAADNPAIKWFNVPGGWKLLPDRLGIQVTVQDPEDNWKFQGVGLKQINGISWWANPPDRMNGIESNGYPPTFRLTVVIEDDLRMPISAAKRVGSPTKFTRWRVADARDHFQYVTIDQSSANFANQGGSGTDPVVIRDDTVAADSHARALRSAHEMPPLAGEIVLPGLVAFYEIGDRINTIAGRNIQLFRNAAQNQDETPTFPVVVARSFSCRDGFYTRLHLTDRRAMPHHNAW
jgi:hypothetical protein